MIECLNVSDVTGIKPQQDGDVGIEIEVEYQLPVEYRDDRTWKTKDDGSLRYYGYEYVTKKPLPIKKVDTLLDPMVAYINKNQPIQNSPRTSVHVHVNVLDHTAVQYCNALLAGWMLENALIKYCEPKLREGNLFCLRAKDAESTVHYAIESLNKVFVPNNTRNPLAFADHQVRYSAQNFMSTSTFGTIEYRSMAGIYETDKISTWTKTLHTLVTNAKDFESPEDLFNYYLRVTPEEFVERILGVHKHVVTNVPYWKELIAEQEGMLCTFAYMTDWKDWASKLSKYNPNAQRGRRGAELFNNPANMDALIARVGLGPAILDDIQAQPRHRAEVDDEF